MGGVEMQRIKTSEFLHKSLLKKKSKEEKEDFLSQALNNATYSTYIL